jgi:acyl carrier protein
LRPHRFAAFLTFPGPAEGFGREIGRNRHLAPPLNSGRRSDIRALETVWGTGALTGTALSSRATPAIYLQYIKGLMMSSTFDKIADIIAETCDIPRDTITPDSHAIDDLGIDSLDFLDIAFAIDKAFGIKLPLEKWTQEVNDGKATTEQYFVLKNLSERIDELVAAKGAPSPDHAT